MQLEAIASHSVASYLGEWFYDSMNHDSMILQEFYVNGGL